MKFKVALDVFLKALSVVMKTIGDDSKGHEGLKLYASKKSGRVKLSTIDGHHATDIWIDATVETAGKAVIRAEKLFKYLSKLDVDTIHFSIKSNGSVLLKSTRGQQTFITYDAENFPTLPKVTPSLSFHIPGKVYQDLVNGVIFCAKPSSKGGAADKLEGINLCSDGKYLSSYATDGISVANTRFKVKSKEMNVTLATKSLIHSTKYVKEDEKVVIQGSDTRFIIKAGDATFHIPIIAGKYPPLETIIPAKGVTPIEFTAEKTEMLRLLERSTIMLESKEAVKGTLQLQKNKVILEGSVEDAHFNEHIAVNGNGKKFDVRFDVKRLANIIKNMDAENVRIGLQKGKPIVIRQDDSDEQVCLLSIG